jgi:hypothetical protein
VEAAATVEGTVAVVNDPLTALPQVPTLLAVASVGDAVAVSAPAEQRSASPAPAAPAADAPEVEMLPGQTVYVIGMEDADDGHGAGVDARLLLPLDEDSEGEYGDGGDDSGDEGEGEGDEGGGALARAGVQRDVLTSLRPVPALGASASAAAVPRLGGGPTMRPLQLGLRLGGSASAPVLGGPAGATGGSSVAGQQQGGAPLGFQDEFMAHADDFSESWREAAAEMIVK